MRMIFRRASKKSTIEKKQNMNSFIALSSILIHNIGINFSFRLYRDIRFQFLNVYEKIQWDLPLKLRINGKIFFKMN
jgi:hypothetical protein